LSVDNSSDVDGVVGFLFNYYVNGCEEVVIDLFFAEVHSTRGVEAAECGEDEVGVGDVDEFHWLLFIIDFMRYKKEGVKISPLFNRPNIVVSIFWLLEHSIFVNCLFKSKY